MTAAGERPAVTIAIVNYNGAACLMDSVASALAQTFEPAGIVVVDNASTDGSAVRAEASAGVRVMALGENLGPGRARNAALERSETPLVLLMDNDVILATDCLERLVDAMEAHDNVAICQARTVYDRQPDLVQCDGGFVHFLGAMIPLHGHASRKTLDDGDYEIDSAITTAILVDREKALQAGGFDEDFFIYFEDHDFAVRTRIAGFRCLAVGAATARHREGTDLSFREGRAYGARHFYLQCRNRWLFALKSYPLRTLFVLIPAFALFECFSFAFACARGFPFEYVRAVAWIAGHVPEIARKRRDIAAVRKLDVRTLLRGEGYPFHPGLLARRWERWVVGALDGAMKAYWKVARALV